MSTLLENGNILISNWASKGNAVQAVEVNRSKKLVWALRSWNDPVDLGRSTTIQMLDKPIEKMNLGNFK